MDKFAMIGCVDSEDRPNAEVICWSNDLRAIKKIKSLLEKIVPGDQTSLSLKDVELNERVTKRLEDLGVSVPSITLEDLTGSVTSWRSYDSVNVLVLKERLII